MTTKDALRAAARAKRVKLAAGLPGYARTIAGWAGEIPLEDASPVASYWPLRDEADPRALAAALAAQGHPILLPCIVGPNIPLELRLWHEGDPMRRNVLGVDEPVQASGYTLPAAVFVPLLAFDALGFRLGYGGGYYDRTVAALRAAGPVLAIGIAYAGQEETSLPRDPHDQRLDMVVTEQGVRRFASS